MHVHRVTLPQLHTSLGTPIQASTASARHMARPTVSPLLPLFLLLLLAAAPASGAGELPLGWIPGAGSGCRGSIGECLAGTEFELASEASRRILARSYYISYAALRRDSAPCSRRGASYYNCRPGAQANPYSRSCSAITRCRR